MPEYLAPAVYVEEVDTGSKPIEGVSTSTAGMIGVTERGPVNLPMLVTSNGEYQRLFGQMLNPALYPDPQCLHLPNAVEGFFTNGGKRVYVTRILEFLRGAPRKAERRLVAPDAAPPLQAQIMRLAIPGTLSATIDADPGFAINDIVQVGDGLSADFPQLNAAPAPANLVTLRLPLDFAHAGADNVEPINGADNVTPGEVHADTVNVAVAARAPAIVGTGAVAFNPALAPGDVFRIDAGDDEELVVAGPGSAGATIQLPVGTVMQYAHAIGAQMHRIDQTAAAAPPAPTTIAVGENVTPGTTVLPVLAAAGFAPGQSVRVTSAANPADVEYRRVGQFTRIPVDQPAYAMYPAGSRVETVILGAAVGGAVDLVDRDAQVGDTVIIVSDRTGWVPAPGMVLQIGLPGTQQETVEVASMPLPRLAGVDRGPVALRAPLRFPHPAGAAGVGTVSAFAAPAAPSNRSATPVEMAGGATTLLVNRAGFAVGDLLRVTTPTGGPYYHIAQAPAAYVPQTLSFAAGLTFGHPAGTLLARRTPMMTVRAIDPGVWGDRLRVAMEEQEPPFDQPLLSTTVARVLPGGDMRLTSTANVEVGTELVINRGTPAEQTFRVAAIDRLDNFRITTVPAWPVAAGPGTAVTSREFRFVVELLRQQDATNPARNTMAIDREMFQNLSLDNRHSRYFETVVGATWNYLVPTTTMDNRNRALRRSDRRSEGESKYVRILDAGFATSTNVRPGPVASHVQVAGAPRRLVLLPLGGGVDDIANIDDQSYIGQDNANPELRTGLFTLRNHEDISIVASPGRTSPGMQMALINHCELMRYRFAVLDGPRPPADSIADVRALRQQYDTKYAALYHPWLLITDPFPAGTIVRQDYPIPPSGHMLGVYARTDIERGVHKAPANEVVRGVIGLQRLLNKEQHDILNPYPVNINVIRDFRPNNRGIRVYGGRCITSDSDWKYVNVRRLLIFIENSIDRGLQWVVFEPNAEPLWARVRRSITNFLTLVWRNGGLEGTKVEEAFFVKCDRTTMTQTDIDQGRLICLVGVAPVKPAEFVIVRIGLWTAHAED